jgi:Cation transporter/ATPase, N-terminus
LAERLGVDPSRGIDAVDAEARLRAFGSNDL